MKLFMVFLFFTLISSCSKMKFNEQISKINLSQKLTRSMASTEGTTEFPPGLTTEERLETWHLSEGSEIYPTLWMVNLKSTHKDFEGSFFLERLDEKYGVIPDNYGIKYRYPIPWVGMTAAWSTTDINSQEEVKLPPNVQFFKDMDRIKVNAKTKEQMISMSGVNCTFCHTGAISYRNAEGKIHTKVIEGAPTVSDVRGFFKDMVGSTLKMMINPEELEAFLVRLDVKEPKEVAKKFSKDFLAELGLSPNALSIAVNVLAKAPLIGDTFFEIKRKKATAVLFAKRSTVEKYFIELIRITYKFEKVPSLLKVRMKYLANLGTPDPSLPETISGFGRTDAFARISNLTARFKEPIPQTAPVSLPPMYAIKYKSLFHYNANTNSVGARNIGQAFGSGSVFIYDNEAEKKYLNSTTNFRNLMKMEQTIYKMEVPELQKIFPEVAINTDKVIRGCKIYKNTCMNCHDAGPERVGPTKQLIQYKVIPINVAETDMIYLKNQATPVDGKKFSEVIFNFTDSVKNAFVKKYNISPGLVDEWSHVDIRGREMFRGTIDGEDRFADSDDLDYTTIKPGRGYQAKSLAGVWATAPYLHNGSVPSIYEMLLPTAKRSDKFLMGKTEYDFKNLGFIKSSGKFTENKSNKDEYEFTKKVCKDSPAECFDTNLYGNSNRGHEPAMYGGELTKEQKYDLIEFLKVLRPEQEYSWKSEPIYNLESEDCIN